MSFDMQMSAIKVAVSDAEPDSEELIWIENLVAGAGVAVAVLFVSSLAVVMYLA